MDDINQIIAAISLSMGTAWASGINLYATLLTLGVLGASGNMQLPANLEILTNPMVMGAAGLMFAVEFFADKTPGVDTGWDAIHTFIRIPAGAMLAAASLGEVNSAVLLTAAILGGSLAAGSHAAKAGTRVMINTSPEPFSNWFASLAEDVAVIAGVWAALAHPIFFLIALLLFVGVTIWLLPRLWSSIKTVFGALGRLFTRR